MKRVPVHAVSGPGAEQWARACTTGRPEWVVYAPTGCPCCAARVAAQVEIARLVRERRPVRILVALRDATHVRDFRRFALAWPLSQYVEDAEALRLPDDAGWADAVAPQPPAGGQAQA